MKKLKIVFPLLAVFLVSAFFISSCSDPVTVSNDFLMNAYDYSDNHYFFDTLYKSSFTDFFSSKTGVYTPETEANKVLTDASSFEVWVQTDSLDANKRLASAIIMLYEQQPEGYHPNLKLIYSVEGRRFGGYFRKLDPSEYLVHSYAGFVGTKANLPDNYAVGVTYKTASGKLFGTPSNTIPANDTLILKLIKCANQSPGAAPLAWELKMKNVYRLPNPSSRTHYFGIEAVYLQDGAYHLYLPGYNKPLTEMIDNVYHSVHLETGYMVIPSLRPFWDNLAEEGVDPSYYYKEIYTHSKTDAANPSIAPNAMRYFISGISMQE